jgi:hypothetical protein
LDTPAAQTSAKSGLVSPAVGPAGNVDLTRIRCYATRTDLCRRLTISAWRGSEPPSAPYAPRQGATASSAGNHQTNVGTQPQYRPKLSCLSATRLLAFLAARTKLSELRLRLWSCRPSVQAVSISAGSRVDELEGRGNTASENRTQRLCSQRQIWSVFVPGCAAQSKKA